MTESEAIEKLKNMRLFMQIIDKNSEHKFAEDDYKTNDMAIQALEEVQQYRAIGTPEECRAAREKQMPKKVVKNGKRSYKCPCCGESAKTETGDSFIDYRLDYCDGCGQKLDWSDEE